MTIFTEKLLRTCDGPERADGSPQRWVWRSRATRKIVYAVFFNAQVRQFSGKSYHLHDWRYLQPNEVERLRRLLPPEAIAECTRASLGVTA